MPHGGSGGELTRLSLEELFALYEKLSREQIDIETLESSADLMKFSRLKSALSRVGCLT